MSANTLSKRLDRLTEHIVGRMRRRYATPEYSTNPSEEQWEGLREVIRTIIAMAEGIEIERSLFLTALSPGTGKTTAIRETVSTLCQMRRYQDVGFILFFQQVEQLADQFKEMNLPEISSVMVSDSYKDAQALGIQGTIEER